MRLPFIVITLALWFTTSIQLLYAQSSSIQLTTPATQLCRGADFTFYFTTSGTFNASTTYRLQLALANNGVFQDVPGTVTASPAMVRLPDNLAIGASYHLRLVASSPAVTSNIIGPLLVQAVPTASLLGSSADSSIVPLGESVSLRLAITGGEPYSVWINDTLRFRQLYPADSYNSFQVVPEKTSTYRITRIQNNCGLGQPSGATTVTVSKVGFRLLPYQYISFCPGDTLYPAFSVDGNLPPSTQFSVDWVKGDGTISHTTTATLQKQSLVAPSPSTLTGFYNGNQQSPYRLVIRNADLAIRSTLSGVYLNPIPTAELTESVSVPFGEQAILLVKTTNGGGTLVMQDSTTANLVGTLTEGISRIFLRPLKTTEYAIKRLYTKGCAAAAQTQGKATVTVTSGIRLDSISRSRVCTGDEVALFYSTNFSFTGTANDLVVEAGTTTPDNKLTVLATFRVVRVDAGKLIFKVSDNLTPAFYAIRVRRLSDGLTSTIFPGITVNTIPSATLFSTTSQLAKPGLYNIYFVAKGGSDGLELTLSDGTRFINSLSNWSSSFDNTLSVQVPATGTYTVTSLRNQCGAGQATGAITITVAPPTTPTIQVMTIGPRSEIPSQAVLCEGQQTTIQFAVTGPRSPGTIYKVEMNEYWGDWIGLFVGSGTTSPVTITLPSYVGNFKLRIVSSEGTISNEVMLSTNAASVAANLTLNYFGPLDLSQRSNVVDIPLFPKSTVYLASSVYSAQIKASSGPLNGKWLVANNGVGEPDFVQNRTSYTVQNVSKTCVQRFYPNTVETNIVPFLLYQNTISPYICAGNRTITIPFLIIGEVPANTRFVVDISDAAGAVRSVAAPGRQGYVRVPIDDLVPDRPYQLLLKAILPNQQVVTARKESSSVNSQLTLRPPLSVTLSAAEKQTIVDLAPDQYSSALLYINGNYNFDAVLTDGRTFKDITGAGFSVQPMRTTTYKIRSVWGSCGYAFPASSVTVRVQPGLRASSLSSGDICRGQKMTVSFQAVGDFEPGHRFGIFIQRPGMDSWQLLTATTDVDFMGDISLPTTIRTGLYRVKVESLSTSSVRVSKEIGYLTVLSIPDYVLSGRATAYVGDLVQFPVSGSGGDIPSIQLQGGSRSVIASLYNDRLRFTASESATYQINGLANGCGVGKATGSVTVQILSTSQTLRLTSTPGILCAGQKADFRFAQTGTFGSTNRFTVQLSDSTGSNFKSLTTTASGSSLNASIPTDIPSGSGYRLRVISSDPVIEGASGQQLSQVSAMVSGTLTGNNSIVKGDSTTLTLTFNGLPTWSYTLQNEAGTLTGLAVNSPHRIRLRVDTTTTYRLTQVSTAACGIGQPFGEAVLTVSVLTAAEPVFASQVSVYPNPTTQLLTVKVDIGPARPMSIYLRDMSGRLRMEKHYTTSGSPFITTLSIQDQPAGIYVLELLSGPARITMKVIKQ